MSDVVFYIAASLDGAVADADGGIDWLVAFNEGGEDFGYNTFIETIDVVIMGSATYEQVLTFGDWAYPKQKVYVMTHRELPQPKDAQVTFYQGDLIALIQSLKAGTTQNIWLVGGGNLASAFINANLIDLYQLFIIPVLVGGGIPLFQKIQSQLKLNLVYHKLHAKGVMELHYRPERS